MTKIQGLQEKVQKATEKVEKCKGAIARHEKQLAKKVATLESVSGRTVDLDNLDAYKWNENGKSYTYYWEACDVASKLRDIDGAKKNLKKAETVLENWKSKLDVEVEQERFLEGNAPQVIKDFLENWKEMAYDWHIKRYEAYQNFKKRIDKEEKEEIISYVESNPEVFEKYLENGKIKDYWLKDLINIRGRGLDKHMEEMKLDYYSIQSRKAHFAGSTVLYMDSIYKEEERLAWLKKTLENDKKIKMLDLINRVNAVIGSITDASNLKVRAGNLNGYIDGENGRAKVETIGAGGYNIQCFHYRTLVNKI